MEKMILKDKIALVTGAGRNVGRGIALRFAREGARVVANDVDGGALDRLQADGRAEGLAVSPAVADVGDADAMGEIIDRVAAERGSLDVLVNNAVIHVNLGERGPFLKVTDQGWREFMRRNLNAMFLNTQRAARIMARQRRGCIINISSNGALLAHRQRIAYDTMKGALESFTRAVAIDLAPWRVRVNAIRPIAVSDIPAEGTEAVERDRRLGAMIPLGRIARPADVAWAAVFLAADDAEFITGQVINVDGGMLVQSRPPQLELEPVIRPEDLPL